MPNIPDQPLLALLSNDYPQYRFVPNKYFVWMPETLTIGYNANLPDSEALLLHELGHACLNHNNYTSDIELIKHESVAWEYAQNILATKYSIKIPKTIANECLEGYKIWLHKRSRCPVCKQTGLQIKKNTYSCLNCRCFWHVNDAKFCNLKRTTTN